MLNPQPGRTISLATYVGNDIPNSIDVDPAPGLVTLARWKMAGVIGAVGVWEVGPATGRYNCHGLVFASRRTNIPPPGTESANLVDRILHEDQYVNVVEAAAREGDLVLWRRGADVDHTGVVCHVERVGIPMIFVWSMWGGLGEFVHRAAVSPYGGSMIEYWRLS